MRDLQQTSMCLYRIIHLSICWCNQNVPVSQPLSNYSMRKSAAFKSTMKDKKYYKEKSKDF